MSTFDYNHFETQFFHQQNAEARHQLREALEAKTINAAGLERLSAESGINEADAVARLRALGFDEQTAPALHLLPLVEVAWADGSVSRPERMRVLQAAHAHGITPESPAGQLLASFMENQPSAEFFDVINDHLRDILVAQHIRADSLLELCREVAAVSGGFFGFGPIINDDEAQAIELFQSKLEDGGATHVRKIKGD